VATSQTIADYRYCAFISYSHEDEGWAKWLQAALETYRVPRRLVGTQTAAGPIPRRLGPVFRDRSDLSTAADLTARIDEALQRSANLIVICSPSACASRWVDQEVRAFRRLGRGHRVHCLIVGGEPNASDLPGRNAEECFPDALRLPADGGSADTRQHLEPIAADVRSRRDGKTDAKLRIIAGLLDVGFDLLKQREHSRRTQRMTAVTAGALVMVLVTSGLAIKAVMARKDAELQQREAEALVDFMLGDLDDKLRQVQRLDILETVDNRAMAYFISRPTGNVTDETLALRAKALQAIGAVRADQGNLPAAVESHRAAAAIMAELLHRAPDDPERRAAYAKALNFIGNGYWFHGDLERAFASFQQAIALLEQETKLKASSAAVAVLASARTNAGRVLEARGDFAGAKGLYDAVEKAFTELAAQEPANTRWQTELSYAYDNLGKVALEQGQLSDAVKAYRIVHQITARLAAERPNDRGIQESLLLSSAILGRTLGLCGADGEAVRLVGEAVGIAKALVVIDSAQADWREELGEYSRLLGSLERGAGHLDTAAQHDAEAMRLLSALAASDPTNSMWRRELVSAQLETGRLQLAKGNLSNAEQLLDTALGTISKERAASPNDRNVQLLESTAHIARGEVAARRHDMSSARAHWSAARDVVSTAARVGADPNFLAAWASALLLLDDMKSAHPVVERLASMGYRTRDFDRLLAEKHQPYPWNAITVQRAGNAQGAPVAGGVE
jgi:eukaryotic-like serine/threonine-protein kinase